MRKPQLLIFMRIAFKIAYIGTDYHGFQIQKNASTIEQELFSVLKELNLIKNPKSARYSGSGRTDAGVHALGQVVAYDTDNPKLSIPRVINSLLPPSIWVWSRAEVPDDFSPRRHAVSREYRYIMCGCANIPLIRKASRLLIGTHDFSNFGAKNNDQYTVRTVKRIDIRLDGDFVTLDIEADSFLWHMVRNIVTALQMIGNEGRDIEWLENMLQPEEFKEGLEPAPAYGLLLKKVNYNIDIPWEDDAYSKKISAKRLHEKFIWHGVNAEIFNELKKSMQS